MKNKLIGAATVFVVALMAAPAAMAHGNFGPAGGHGHGQMMGQGGMMGQGQSPGQSGMMSQGHGYGQRGKMGPGQGCGQGGMMGPGMMRPADIDRMEK
jgi:hypothetical protein